MKQYDDLFKEYEQLTARADAAFQNMEKDYAACVKCAEQCADCCSAVFGLFLIESAYLNLQINALGEESKRAIMARADEADEALLAMEKRLQEHSGDSNKLADAIGKERVRCPLLGDDRKCRLYSVRPITCRVYGIPAMTNGKVHACFKAGFEKGRSYPVFNLDGMYKELYRLSAKFLERAGVSDTERAALLLSVSKSIKTPLEDLLQIDNGR
ncbi:YkgJ family cysteine cluster protein [Desulfoscipio sp. XC116]|uniref:YkgJ family cysteine cluster protein n=1 Tax=Desulfoscipio sp. XC116 TaxID=3144975 RepID=UPI00325AC3C0